MASGEPIKLFMCGDVMVGRGIDQILPFPSPPILYESHIQDARDYVRLAEDRSGGIRSPVPFDYVWGDALAELERVGPDVRLVNLETSVTTSDDYWPGKGINYRMHPRNIPCLTAAGIQCCSLANNHVVDWGWAGLSETIETLNAAGLSCAGAGLDLEKARAPAVHALREGGRVLVFGLGSETSGIPSAWAAGESSPGLNLVPDLSLATADAFGEWVRCWRRPGDVVVASLHWGPNWGYGITAEEIAFAHRLVEVGVDVLHGHSSHHVKGIEVYQRRLITYGCGDFLNDYEGIGGHEAFAPNRALMYFASFERASGRLVRLELVPTMMNAFRVVRARSRDAELLRDLLSREGRGFGTSAELIDGGGMLLQWDRGASQR